MNKLRLWYKRMFRPHCFVDTVVRKYRLSFAYAISAREVVHQGFEAIALIPYRRPISNDTVKFRAYDKNGYYVGTYSFMVRCPSDFVYKVYDACRDRKQYPVNLNTVALYLERRRRPSW